MQNWREVRLMSEQIGPVHCCNRVRQNRLGSREEHCWSSRIDDIVSRRNPEVHDAQVGKRAVEVVGFGPGRVWLMKWEERIEREVEKIHRGRLKLFSGSPGTTPPIYCCTRPRILENSDCWDRSLQWSIDTSERRWVKEG